jgi:hypothetical protein
LARPIIVRFIRAVPTRRVLLVTATGAVDTYKFGAQARAMVSHHAALQGRAATSRPSIPFARAIVTIMIDGIATA